MSIRKMVLLATTLMSFSVFAEECEWIGGSGNWSDTANWRDGKVPRAGQDSATFANAAAIEIKMNVHCYVTSLFFRGKDVTFTRDDSSTLYMDAPGTVEVAEGTTVALNAFYGRYSSTSEFHKTGLGRLKQTASSGNFFSYEVAEGVLELATTPDAFNACSIVTVRAGAKVETSTANQTQNNVVFLLDEGAEFVAGQSDCIGGVFGKGVCSGSSLTFTLPAAGGPWEAHGIYTNVVVTVQGAKVTESEANKSKRRLTICRGDAFKDADLSMSQAESNVDFVPDTLRFAPRIGDFYIRVVDFRRVGGALDVTDTAGEPIRLHCDLYNPSCMPFSGAGVIDFCLSGKQSCGTIQADLFEDFTGEIWAHRSLLFGKVNFPTAADRAVSLGGVKCIRTANNARITFASGCDATVDTPIVSLDGSQPDVHLEASPGTCRLTNLHFDDYKSFIVYPGGFLEFGDDTYAFATMDNNYIKGNKAKPAGLRVTDNAFFHVGVINMRYGSDAWQTNIVEIAGNGVLETSAFSNPSKQASEGNTRIRFLGGTLSMFGDNDRSLFDGAYPYHQVTVADGKAVKIRCGQDTPSKGVKLGVLLRREGTTDAGLEKSGAGCLNVPVPQTELSGPVVVKAGRLVSTATAAGATFGAGDVTLRGATLGFLGGAGVTKTVPALGYSGVAQIFCMDASTTADALSVQTLTASGDAPLLCLRSDQSGYKAGTNYKVTVADGVELLENGLPKSPVVAFAPEANFTRGRFSFVTYDGTDGFKPLTPKAFDAAGTGDVAILEAPTTLTADKAVHSLSIGGSAFDSSSYTANSLNLGSKKLTLGDGTNPALVFFNCAGKDMSPFYSGTVDFGGSRGYILIGGSANNIRQNAKFSGSNGVVYASVGDVTQTVWAENGSCDYTGGTWIENVRVIPRSGTAFGPANATVTVTGNEGWGGTLYLDASYAAEQTRPYAWKFAGYGVRDGATAYGAVYMANPSLISLRGTVELTDEALFKVVDGAALTVEAPISGVGRLVKDGVGKLTLKGDNSGWAAGLRIVAGSVYVSDAKQLGAGSVFIERAGRLVFDCAEDIVVTNRITGGGKIECVGTGSVKLANAADFYGTVTAVGGSIIGADGAARVAGYYDATLSGAKVSLVKDDDGVTTLAMSNTYGGATTVSSGTLVLGRNDAYAEGILARAVCHLDAAKGVTLKEGTATKEIESWSDIDNRYTFTQACTIAGAENPVYHEGEDGMNGKSTVFFTGFKNRLVASTDVPGFRTMILVHRAPAGAHPKSWSCAGVYGTSGSDSGVRVSGGTDAVRWFNERGNYYVNSVEQQAIPCGEVLVSTVLPQTLYTPKPAVIGDYWGNAAQNRCYWGDIGELVLFAEELTLTERRAVERYLMEKWGAKEPIVVTENILPETTDLTVRAGATVDLNGCDQTVASLAGGGTIINTADRAVTLTVTGDCAFFGALADNVKLVIAPAGEGAVGTCTVSSAAVLAGATFLCDVLGTEADRIDFVGGDFDVSTVALTVSASASATPLKAPVLTTVGELSGTFKSAACPPTLKLKYRYDDRAVVVDSVRGILLLVR